MSTIDEIRRDVASIPHPPLHGHWLRDWLLSRYPERPDEVARVCLEEEVRAAIHSPCREAWSHDGAVFRGARIRCFAPGHVHRHDGRGWVYLCRTEMVVDLILSGAWG
jgi:hypothetical protein